MRPGVCSSIPCWRQQAEVISMATGVLRGGCLCGTVTYEVESPLLRFAHCHCSRCRRATGSSHASNLYVVPRQFHWTSGEESVRRYDLPSAPSFSTTFCSGCGSPLPHHTRSGLEIVVPAGSLEGKPDLDPQAHIFFESRPGWSCLNRELPQFREYTHNWRSGVIQRRLRYWMMPNHT